MGFEEEMTDIGVFPGVASEMQFQALLADERTRGEQHKKNYQRLKADHSRLEDEYRSLRNEIQRCLEELRETQTNSAASLELAQRALHDKQRELESLREQISRPIKERQTSSRDTSKMAAQLASLESECETLHQELNHHRYQSSMELAQAKFDLTRASREMQELRTKHAIELQALQEVTEALTSPPSSSEPWREVHQALKRENLLLRSRTEGLLTEVTALRSEAQRNSSQAEENTRAHLRTLVMQATSSREVESEKQRLQLKSEALHSELTLCRNSHSSLLVKQRDLKKALSEASDLLSSTKDVHRGQVEQLEEELANQRLLTAKVVETMDAQIQSVQLELKLSLESEAKQVALLSEREKKWEHRTATEKENSLHKLKQAEEQRQDLERRLAEMEAEIRRQDFGRKEQVQTLKDRLIVQSSALEKEQLQVRDLQKDLSELREALEREKVQRFESEQGREEAQGKVLEMQRRVKGQTERLRQQAQQTQEQLKNIQIGETHELESLKKLLQHEEENHREDQEQLKKKIDDLEFQLRSTKLSNSKAVAEKSKKMKRLVQHNTKFRLKLSELKSKDKIKCDRRSDEH